MKEGINRLLGNKKVVTFVGSTLMLLMLTTLFVDSAFAATAWLTTRPTRTTQYNHHIENTNTDNMASVGVGTEIIQWVENNPDLGYKDTLSFRVTSAANTRTGISYTVGAGNLESWLSATTPTGIIYDDQSLEFNLPYPFRFYGKTYMTVWVCSNGFLSFDSSSTSYSPQSIPNGAAPNTLVAGLWRDLRPDSSGTITYFSGVDNGLYVFAVSWNNVRNYANLNRQTFQIILRQNRYHYQDDIVFSYVSITNDVFTTVGIEDKTGLIGTAYSYTSLGNNMGLLFSSSTTMRTIRYLTIKVEKQPAVPVGFDWWSAINVQPSEIGGYNVRLQETRNIAGQLFLTGIKFLAPIMISSALGPEAGIIFKLILIDAETAYQLSQDLSPPLLVGEHSAGFNENLAYVKAEGALENPADGYLTDSTLATTFIWVFDDVGTSIDHKVTVTAELEYLDWETGIETISSSVSITVLRRTGGSFPGCPILSVYDGSGYVSEGLLDIHDPTGADKICQHTLVSTPQEVHHFYQFQLVEHPKTHSYIDQVKLYAILEDGTKAQLPLTRAWHSEYGNVLPRLLFSDDWKTDTLGADLNNGISQSIDLKFAALSENMEAVAFMFQIEGNNMLPK